MTRVNAAKLDFFPETNNTRHEPQSTPRYTEECLIPFVYLRVLRGSCLSIAGYRYSTYHAATMRLTYSLLLVMLASLAWAQTSSLTTEVETVYPDAHALYLDLHQSPELSSHETQTAQKLAGRLRELGYTVTERVGGTGGGRRS
jgi:hypothetical protein